MAETLPSMSDAVRKRTIADWVVKTKKQVVKLYAVVKWSRDAETVQKCMNIIGFILLQNREFGFATQGLLDIKEELDPNRVRNHDLLTSLDVLTTGSYLRLPSCIKKLVVPPTPLNDEQVKKTLVDMESAILYRLRMTEIIPVEMSRYKIADGRVHFTVPKLFEASLCLQGPTSSAGWFFVHVEFLINVGGDLSGLQEFPRIPPGIIKRHITDEADFRLSYYIFQDMDPERPKLPENVVDTPLIRLYNFLRNIHLSTVFAHSTERVSVAQAGRMRTLGWGEYLSVNMSADRKTLKVSYWLRPPPPANQPRPRTKQPPHGGSLTIAIETVDPHSSRTPKEHVMARLQQELKLGNAKPSDTIEKMRLRVTWEPSQGVLGVDVAQSEVNFHPSELEIDADNLDFESLLLKVIDKHVTAILKALTFKLQHDPNGEFSAPGVVTAEKDTLSVRLCADEVVTINIDSRTGRINLRDTNGLVVAGRAPRFYFVALTINQAPELLIDRLKQKAQILGLQYYKSRNFTSQGLDRLGKCRGMLFILVSKSQQAQALHIRAQVEHYLVLVVKTKGFSYALITASANPSDPLAPLKVDDVAYLDYDRLPFANSETGAPIAPATPVNIYEWIANDFGASTGFDLTTQMLKELFRYCCARVAYMTVEKQLKVRGIPFKRVAPTSGIPLSPELAKMQSPLARSVPALCVQATHILSGAPAAEAAMPNIRVIPINWWSSHENVQVITCVKLKYVQQPFGKRAGGGSSVIRPSKRIIYDTKEAVVSFLSENVDTCVDEFLEEWARVSKMVVIAREIAKMSKERGWKDIKLLSFDLQTVEFAYAPGYSVSITCENQLSIIGGKFDLRFTRHGDDDQQDTFNPHDDAEPYLSNILHHGHNRLASALESLVRILTDTLPIAVELESIRKESMESGFFVDTFAKASGWYRILYPDLKHALDFRVLRDHRVAIVDASHPLHKPARPAEPPTPPPSDSMNTDPPEPSSSTATVSASTSTSTSLSASSSQSGNAKGSYSPGLQPLPGFAEIVKEAVAATLKEQKGIKYLVNIDVGVVCETSIARLIARKLHEKVAEKLKAS
ncbi:hypothetical protein CC1G_02060 [Coprinopsis cinerea okayama7|uniref:Mediator of RNA polymerase II transcription subunit 14 n=1 Tax=Coprinopsis cinerea (strain Okayama-7 / 130 / ATCC MYA-4618 / FGSC 9003) TaxID=240176 RepID=A8N6F7_COPC7|nr:hypothetical protein CC1G_02060 [Coprinopsis cinerea okayama7\|eukprot:XP_001830424.2 hypothetical protein CC1G_02060 [Coprinopsis cinerea okayama7\